MPIEKHECSLEKTTRSRIAALQQRLVRIQTQCIVTRDSIDMYVQRCAILEDSLRTVNAFKNDPDFVIWRSLVSRMWHRFRQRVHWPEDRGLKYLSREMRDLDARLKRQCACVEWGMSESVFLCSSALADQENPCWEALRRRSGNRSNFGVVPDFGCAVVAETMEYALDKLGLELDVGSDDYLADISEESSRDMNAADDLTQRDVALNKIAVVELATEIVDTASDTRETAPIIRNSTSRRSSRIPRISTAGDRTPLPAQFMKRQSASIVHLSNSKIPIVPTLQRKRRASVAAIPLTPPSPPDSRRHVATCLKDAEKRAKLQRSLIPTAKAKTAMAV